MRSNLWKRYIEEKSNYHIEDIKSIEDALSLLYDAFEKSIMEKINNECRICCHLSSGLDTRSILSVLLKNNIKPTILTDYRYDEEVNIVKTISKDFDLDYKIFQENGKDTAEKYFKYNFMKFGTEKNFKFLLLSQKEFGDDFDLIFSGLLMSETWRDEKYIFPIIYTYLPLILNLVDINNNIVFPAADYRVMLSLEKIPFGYKSEKTKFLQRKVINYFYPELLNYPRLTNNGLIKVNF